MTTPATARSLRVNTVMVWGMAALTLTSIWLDRKWPGSTAHVVVRYAQMTWFLGWFGSMIWRGYQRRKPYWTRESWRRYLRLAAMPVVMLVAFFSLVFLFDARPELFGARESALRLISAVFDMALMLIAVVGIVMAIGWLERGEASEQFTRPGWFSRKPRAS